MVETDAKLALAEKLLASTDLQRSAREGAEWLAVRAGVAQIVIALAEPGSPDLLVIAEYGLPGDAAADFLISRDDSGHPLVRAMDRLEPTYFASSAGFRTPLDGRPFHAVGLREPGEQAFGLLLVDASGPEMHHDVAWCARVLGYQLARLASRQTLAETRFGQERMLLYSIINAVTDPILLTDTEGKLIIANTHAEKLFAAPEDASEGWRRAVALNNMLFSAALSTTAVVQAELARRELLLVDSSCSAPGPRTSGRAPSWCRSSATSPTWRGRGRRSKKATERSGWPRPKSATSGTASTSSSIPWPTRSW
jgi:PAS domain-containing protein